MSVFTLACVPTKAAIAKCAQIYYDRMPSTEPGAKPYTFGRSHALFLQNLLGHFPRWQQIVLPIDAYQSGDLERCDVSFYLGTHYASAVPAAFYDDYELTKKTVVWMGYQIWKLGPEALDALWKVRFRGLSSLNREQVQKNGDPGFYRFVDYRGERFEKFSTWKEINGVNTFLAAFEIGLFDRLSVDRSREVATAVHSGLKESSPYALHSGNHWYVAESPFAFMSEDDRYVVFADMLFDILGEPPVNGGKRLAFVRVEDVHPHLPPWQLKKVLGLLDAEKVPYAISVIPRYVDPRGIEAYETRDRDLPMTAVPEMVKILGDAVKGRGSLILHGYTHQYGLDPNPFSAVSGDDFEFWDRVRNRPIREESVKWASERLEDAIYLIERAGQKYGQRLPLSAWLTPHYQASPLICTLFSQLWTWTIGRNIYFAITKKTVPSLPAAFRLDVGGTAKAAEREAQLKGLSVEYDRETEPSGQFFPYEIFGDVYGQRVIPENLGNLQPYLNEQVHKARTIDDVIRTMRRNRNLRDAWASLFVHPSMVGKKEDEGLGEFSGDTREIRRLIRAAKELGYEFIDLKSWGPRAERPLRPEPLERER